MKKFVFFIVIGFLSIFTASYAADYYNASSYNSDLNINVGTYKALYGKLNRVLQTRISAPTKYSEVIKSFRYSDFYASDIPNGFRDIFGSEVKFVQTKSMCPIINPNLNKVDISKACGKVIIDTTGFNNAPNRYFSDTSTVMVKDRFVLYLFANAVKPKYNTPEDILLYAEDQTIKTLNNSQ